MCKECADLAKKYYPDLPEEDLGELLSATAFPFGDPAYLEKQLIELREKTDGTLHGAIVFAHEEMDRVWEEGRPAREALRAKEEEEWELLVRERERQQALAATKAEPHACRSCNGIGGDCAICDGTGIIPAPSDGPISTNTPTPT